MRGKGMSVSAVLIIMLFAHIVDDFYLQGILAKLKQKGWWEENAPDKLYKHDYIIALIIHALSWAIMITLPILFVSAWQPHWAVYLMLGINLAIHAVVDDLKANKRKINLIADQSIHFVQIIVTWCVWAFAL